MKEIYARSNIIKDACTSNNLEWIDNCNLDKTCLVTKRLKVNRKGCSYLANYLKNFSDIDWLSKIGEGAAGTVAAAFNIEHNTNSIVTVSLNSNKFASRKGVVIASSNVNCLLNSIVNHCEIVTNLGNREYTSLHSMRQKSTRAALVNLSR